jgi:hypothetical protein
VRLRAALTAALLSLTLALQAQEVPVDPLQDLAAQGRWEELLGASAERLAQAPDDVAALYWSGRAQLERGRSLLSGSRFAQEMGRDVLHRAAELLGRVPPASFADAPTWAFFARYSAGDDEDLAADLERAAAAGSGYAARLRGLVARDRGEPGAVEWLARAAQALPEDATVRLEWAAELAARGDRAGALAGLEEARRLGADRAGWLATLLAALPGPENTGELLARLQPLLQEPGAERDAPLAWYHSWALEQAGRLIEAEAVLAAATDDLRPEVQRAHARLLLRVGRPTEAAALAAPLAEAGDADALELLVSAGDALAQAFRWDEALSAYDRALSIEPAHGRAAANGALTESRAGRELQRYPALVAKHPERADVLNDAGLSEAARGHATEARALFERAAGLPDDQPGVHDARENLAALLLAGPAPDPAAALGWLDGLLAIEPGRDRSLTLRALALRLAR